MEPWQSTKRPWRFTRQHWATSTQALQILSTILALFYETYEKSHRTHHVVGAFAVPRVLALGVQLSRAGTNLKYLPTVTAGGSG